MFAALRYCSFITQSIQKERPKSFILFMGTEELRHIVSLAIGIVVASDWWLLIGYWHSCRIRLVAGDVTKSSHWLLA